MAEQIEGTDGVSANRNLMGVNGKGQALTSSVIETILEEAASDGRSFNINTGVINLTSANKSACLYLKNNGDKDLLIPLIGFLLGNSTGGTGDFLVEVVRNPTAGTIVSGASAVAIESNKNYGSTKALTVDVFKGAEGNTITNGTPSYSSLLAGAARPYVITTGLVILPKGASIGVDITPQTSNTSTDLEVFLSVIEAE